MRVCALCLYKDIHTECAVCVHVVCCLYVGVHKSVHV